MRPGHGSSPPGEQRVGAGWPSAVVVPDLAAPATARLAHFANVQHEDWAEPYQAG